jgi:glycosyltransferase involved in cell wall biosynthesis
MVLTKDMLQPILDIRVYKEARSLIQAGYNVTVLCRVYSLEDVSESEIYEGINVIRQLCELPTKTSKNRISQLIQNFKNVRSMADRIINLKPDIIHAHDLNALLESIYAKRELQVPLIYDSHEDWPLQEKSKGSNLFYIGALFYENFFLHHVDHVITVSETISKKFESKKSTTIVHNFPVARDFVPDKKVANQIREKYDLENKIVIEYHGVISLNKGTGKLLDVSSEIVKDFKNIKILIIGSGFERFQKYIQENDLGLEDHVIFTGAIDFNILPSYVSVIDIGYNVQEPTPHNIIGSPNKVYETMLMSKPMIVNKNFPNVIKAISPDSSTPGGIAVDFQFDEIKRGLLRLIKDKKFREKCGENARNRALKNYIWENEEIKLIEVYDKISK